MTAAWNYFPHFLVVAVACLPPPNNAVGNYANHEGEAPKQHSRQSNPAPFEKEAGAALRDLASVLSCV